MNKLQLYSQIFKNMGWDYFQFRAVYEIKRKTGLLKTQFPTNPTFQSFITLKDWKEKDLPFFFSSKAELSFAKTPSPSLQKDYEAYLDGKLRYFNAGFLDIGNDYNWITNPVNGYQYDINQHWTEVEDLSTSAGDIKFTWEKSRFSFLYTLIRYDYHFEEDCAEKVLSEIESWIQVNPVNQGPNYKCSQEISIRLMNWTFALYYYKDSSALTEDRFQKIIGSIYWQLKHVHNNINFSRKTVRNNHAVTEVLMLYLSGLLFPFFPESASWKRKGKQWFEQEIAYQVYEDGTYLQFSHNYHRVLIQLLTWAFYLSDLHDESFTDLTYNRATKSLDYLFQCTDEDHGHLPNFGHNDGALFFKLNEQPFRDYRPQLNALYYYFNRKKLFEGKGLSEDIHWFSQNLNQTARRPSLLLKKEAARSFKKGGYFTIKEEDSFSFIRCGKFRNRPYQADNLHLDLWYKGHNILRDAGTYKYNTEQKWLKFFNGSIAHNTVTLAENDQMLKGPRFIWLYWSQAVNADLKETEEAFHFSGKIKAFQHLGTEIYHERKVKKYKDKLRWEIEDTVLHSTNLPMIQHWNLGPEFKTYFKINAVDEKGNPIDQQIKEAYYSGLYGVKESTEAIHFSTPLKKRKTVIERI